MAETVQQLLRERAGDAGRAVAYGDRSWTWAQHLDDAAREAASLIALADRARPLHVGTLLANGPDMLTAMAAAGLGGYVLAGINNTRRGEALARDILRADCQLLLTDAAHRGLLDGLHLPGVRILDVDSAEWTALLQNATELVPHREVSPTDTFMLIFTSGTSGEPKAVRVAHMMIPFSGTALVQRFSITSDDVCYLSMPLFHSNALLAGWSVAVTSGAAMAPATFSASRLLDDLRRYGVTYLNYVGKPLAYVLATPERRDDHDNPLRVAFGNEAAERDIAEFGRRFGCTVWDGFGSTEGAVIITRDGECPPGSVGRGFPGVAVYNPETLTECPAAVFDANGALSNPREAIGEIVNTTGPGLFGGYYNDDAATGERLRQGMYWSGDLAYRDADGWIYLAGRTGEWLRVDGENLSCAPIERILHRLHPINRVAVYAVPDDLVGDAVMAAIVLRDGASLSPGEFTDFLSAQADLSPKAWPRYVWIADDLPVTATNKVIKRHLTAQAARIPHGILWERAPRSRSYRSVNRTGPAH
ncbi:MAG: fatty-acid--CoA ligase FadD1 [Mycobacterium sp.]